MKFCSAVAVFLVSAKAGIISAATCGGGNIGDGVCAGGLCCSQVRLHSFSIPAVCINDLWSVCFYSGVGAEQHRSTALEILLQVQHRHPTLLPVQRHPLPRKEIVVSLHMLKTGSHVLPMHKSMPTHTLYLHLQSHTHTHLLSPIKMQFYM
jgi:hypothetical protein